MWVVTIVILVQKNEWQHHGRWSSALFPSPVTTERFCACEPILVVAWKQALFVRSSACMLYLFDVLACTLTGGLLCDRSCSQTAGRRTHGQIYFSLAGATWYEEESWAWLPLFPWPLIQQQRLCDWKLALQCNNSLWKIGSLLWDSVNHAGLVHTLMLPQGVRGWIWIDCGGAAGLTVIPQDMKRKNRQGCPEGQPKGQTDRQKWRPVSKWGIWTFTFLYIYLCQRRNDFGRFFLCIFTGCCKTYFQTRLFVLSSVIKVHQKNNELDYVHSSTSWKSYVLQSLKNGKGMCFPPLKVTYERVSDFF